jgi:hypothetical protein
MQHQMPIHIEFQIETDEVDNILHSWQQELKSGYF